MKPIIAIDPGCERSALLKWNGVKVLDAAIEPNGVILEHLYLQSAGVMANLNTPRDDVDQLYIEMMQCFGMVVGHHVLDTCRWIGRFEEAWTPRETVLVTRMEVKHFHCRSSRAKDSHIRQALIDRFGQPGTKKQQGVTYGLSKDLWSAFAIAVMAWDKLQLKAGKMPSFNLTRPQPV